MKALNIIKYITALIGLACFVSAWFAFKNSSAFIDRAEKVEGEVIEMIRSRSGESYTYKPVVEFTAPSGEQIEFASSSSSNPPSYAVGELVDVLYDPDDPHNALIAGSFSLWFLSILLSIFAFFFAGTSAGLFGRGFLLIRNRKYLAIQRETMSADIIVFAKAAESGNVKTRIAATVGDDKATEVYIELLNKAVWNAVEAAKQAGCLASIYFDGPRDHPEFERLASLYPSLNFHPQVSGDLGQRMYSALEHSLESHDVALIIGADCPALNPAIIQQALTAARPPKQFCFVPAADGGYVLIASCKPDRAVFSGIEWGSDSVMASTARQLDANQISWSTMEPLADVDTWADYQSQKELL